MHYFEKNLKFQNNLREKLFSVSSLTPISTGFLVESPVFLCISFDENEKP